MPESDFLERFEKYMEIGKKEARNKHYRAEIEPFLLEVARDLPRNMEIAFENFKIKKDYLALVI